MTTPLQGSTDTVLSDTVALLASMKPRLVPGEFVFCSLVGQPDVASLHPVLTFQEEEGLSLILRKETADLHALHYTSVWAQITLSVYSALTAVGFLASVAQKLSAAGISINAVSAYHHDHLFVPADRAACALSILEAMQSPCMTETSEAHP